MPNQRMEFSVVAALIRLGHKYQMTALRDAALARLQTCFTTSFAVWAELTRYEPHRSASMSFRRRDAIAVVNLARLTGTASVLPGALYLCCQLSAQELVSGLHGPDGVCERLAPDDLARCIDGRSALLSHTAHVVARILSPSVSVHCLEPPACRVTLEACLQSFQSPESKALQSHDVLQSWEDAFDTYGVPMERLCEKCFDLLWLREFQERQKIWKILPELMGVEVPDWLAKSEIVSARRPTFTVTGDDIESDRCLVSNRSVATGRGTVIEPPSWIQTPTLTAARCLIWRPRRLLNPSLMWDLIRHVSDYARASEDPETQRECNRVALALGIIARVPLASMLTFLPFLNHSRLNAVVRCASSTVATASQRIETEVRT
ncbi:hypothetical protein IEO21_06270 [Rhodonia placenta]|uniref:Uncharacterized protein n=1 Tax=Rhodonia placenta TaxID=104341 RepID=A0A8H7P0L2_9APHY|nr:hypothetical protein IEO21_06270 [Postia placenta]